MSLELVSDNTIELQVYNFQDIAACARKFADQLEAGEQGNVSRVILVIETPEGLALSGWGECFNGFELIGILDSAKQLAYESNIDGDE